MLPEWQQRQRTDETPEQNARRAPAENRARAAGLALKQQPEGSPDDDRYREMEQHADHARVGVDESGDQRKEVDLLHPLSERPAAADPRDPAGEERASGM